MNYCPGCLKEGHETYCSSCRKILFNGKKVSHILPFSRPEFDTVKINNSQRLSISGIQVKHSLYLDGNVLKLNERNGQYILKPIPHGAFQNLNAVPANEHLSMQIASQVFKINTAKNAVIFFSDGEMAYITKRFDVLEDGKKLLQEDFAQIMQRTETSHGRNFKYNASYEGIAKKLEEHVAAYAIEIEKFYKIILYNYLISNGDAHLKNFSLFRNEGFGDYILTPAYDIMNTSLHVPGERELALDLFSDGYTTEAFQYGNKYTRPDFFEFAVRIFSSNNHRRVDRFLTEIISDKERIIEMVNRSYLPPDLKEKYIESIDMKRDRLKY
ncbi:MAG TPA: HipA domain-containing protein [Ignavibacteriales bacterium]|nr:HipA domain-containing protein [Ignavibacteriales bacterium]